MAAASTRAGTGTRAKRRPDKAAESAQAERDRLEAERDKAHAERDEARQHRNEARTQLAAIKEDLAEASANVEAWLAELADARRRAAEAETLLEAERSRNGDHAVH
jgi:chromosome segregation ATPase